MAAQQGKPPISVEPDPVPEGGSAEVSYDGGGSLHVSFDFGPWQEVPVDPRTGKATVHIPAGTRVAGFWDFSKRPGITVEVVQLSPG